MTVAELEAKKASLAAKKDEAVAKYKDQIADLNAQLRRARAAEKVMTALEGLTDEERAEALGDVT